MLGWKIIERGEYNLPLPSLSLDEERLIIAIEDLFGKELRKMKVQTKKEFEEHIRSLIPSYANTNNIQLDFDL